MTFLRRLLHSNFAYALLVFALILTVYVRTLMPATLGGDAGELQYAGPLLALVHPTGQPLYVTLGYVWSHLIPFGSMAWRMNLLSAVSAAAGCAALTWLFARAYGVRVLAAATGLTLGLGAALWGQAVLADKYGFNVLLTALLVGLALWWGHVALDNRRGAPSVHPYTKTSKTFFPLHNTLLYALSLTFGICLLHHRSLALFAPMLGVMVIYYERLHLLHDWRRTLRCAALVIVPALVTYPLFLPLARARELSPLLWQPNDAAGWLDWLLERHVLTNEALVFDNAANIASQLQIYLETIVNDYTLMVLPVAFIGFCALVRREPLNGLFLLVSYGLQAFLSANWRGNDRQFTYYLPSFVVLIYAYGYGLYALWGWTSSRAVGAKQRFAPTLIALVAVVVPILQFANTYPARYADAVYGEPLDLWRSTMKTGDQGARLAAGLADLPENAVLAADWEQITILWYTQQVEGVRPDVMLVYPIERYTDFTDRPLCLARHLPVGAEWHPSSVGALICLNREPVMDLPVSMTPLSTILYDNNTPQLELAGYTLARDVVEAGTHLPLILTWRAAAQMSADYALSLRILDEAWAQVLPSNDIAAPVMGMYPTSRWTTGEVVQDYHELGIPLDMPAGRYLWTIVVYRQLAEGTFVQLQDEAGNINILGGTFEITPHP